MMELIPELDKLRNKESQSKRVNFSDITGKTFGRWIVLSRKENDKKGGSKWLCECVCGGVKVVGGYMLNSGQSQSCGCLQIERSTKHGMAVRVDGKKSRIYNIYQVMRKRCNNTNDDHYRDYGGRGIMCLWGSFEDFYQDMGVTYESHVREFGEKNTSIDRIDNYGNYCKENCRRATAKQQANNRRNTKLVVELRKLRNDGNDPLTWGRLCSVAYSAPYSDRIFSINMNIVGFLSDNPILYDQNELQRMQHEKRPELKNLLIRFSDYL